MTNRERVKEYLQEVKQWVTVKQVAEALDMDLDNARVVLNGLSYIGQIKKDTSVRPVLYKTMKSNLPTE